MRYVRFAVQMVDQIGAAQFFDVRGFQLGMMYLVYAAFLGILGRLGWLLGGATLSFAVMAFTFTAWIFMGLGFLGGAPRMYAYPLIALILYALIRDRPFLLVVTVVSSGMLYPIVAPIGGLCLAGWMLVRPLSAMGRCRNGAITPLGNRDGDRLSNTGGAATDVARQPAYGRRVNATDVALYPEAGPDGNYRAYDQLPYKLFSNEWAIYSSGPCTATAIRSLLGSTSTRNWIQ